VSVLQLPAKPRLVVSHTGDREETLLEVAPQQVTPLSVLDRPVLRVENALDALDDLVAMSHEQLQQIDVCLKRHFARRPPSRLLGHHAALRSEATQWPIDTGLRSAVTISSLRAHDRLARSRAIV
jgi:hypothetical protein